MRNCLNYKGERIAYKLWISQSLRPRTALPTFRVYFIRRRVVKFTVERGEILYMRVAGRTSASNGFARVDKAAFR